MSSFRDRILNYEQEPPSSLWQKISATLDESDELNTLATKLYNTATPPPPFTWEKIKKELDNIPVMQSGEEKLAPVRKIRSVWKYAAAAMLIGALAYGIIRFTAPPAPGQQQIASQSGDTNTDQKNAITESFTTPVPKPVAEGSAEEKSESIVKKQITIAKSVVTKAYQKTNTGFKNQEIKNTGLVYTLPASVATRDYYEEADPAERYIVLKKTDGQYVRLSKKWGDMVCCVSGEEQDDPCKKQLEQWQLKLARADISASGNFMDLLNIVSSLD